MRSVARRSMTTIYDDLWNVDGIEQWLASEERLQPRSPSSLFDLVADIGLNETTPILDAGCGLGIYAGEMVKRFGSRVVALDPVESNIASARAVAAENNFGERMANPIAVNMLNSTATCVTTLSRCGMSSIFCWGPPSSGCA